MFILRHSKKSLLVLLAILVGVQSCIRQEDFEFNSLAGVKANPSIALPLLNGSLTIDDLVPAEESGKLSEDADGLIHLVYSDTLKSTSIHDYFLLPQLNLYKYYPAVAGPLLPDGQRVVTEEREILDLSFPDADFETLILKEGRIKVESGSSYASTVQLQLRFPTLTRNGQPLEMELTLPAGSQYKPVELEKNMAGYEADFSSYPKGENYIPVDIKAKMEGEGSALINPADQLTLSLEMFGLKFNLLTGDFGQLEVELPSDAVSLATFDKIFSKGQFGLKNPMLNFEILNSNGVPLEVTAQVLQARNKNGEITPIEIEPASPFHVSYPTAYGETENMVLAIKNVREILDAAPSFIDYKLSGRLNVTPPPVLNFLTDSSATTVILNADIPLWGYMEGISLTDTMALNLPFEDVQAENAALRLLVENEFPLEAGLQIDFVNENYDVLESLFTGGAYETLLPASKVNAGGDLSSAGMYNKDIEISRDRFERILLADKIIIRALLHTSKNADGTFPHVKIKSGYKLKVNMGVKATANLTMEL